MAPMRKDLYHLGGREMTVPAHEEVGGGPVPSQIRQEPDQAHGLLQARGTLPRPEARHH
jgi:hypothetical protein